MPEYAFDVKLWAVCRVQADSEKEARTKMLEALVGVEVDYDADGIKITEASIEDAGEDSELIEVDGEAV